MAQDLSSVTSMLSGFVDKIGIVIVIALALGIALAILLLIFYVRSFNLSVYILNAVGNTAQIIKAKGKLIKKGGEVEAFKIAGAKYRKSLFAPPDPKCYFFDRNKLALIMLQKGDAFTPLALGNPTDELEAIPADMKFWYVQEKREAYLAYQLRNTLLQILPYISLVVLLIIMFMIFVMLFKRIDALIKLAGDASRPVVQVMQPVT